MTSSFKYCPTRWRHCACVRASAIEIKPGMLRASLMYALAAFRCPWFTLRNMVTFIAKKGLFNTVYVHAQGFRQEDGAWSWIQSRSCGFNKGHKSEGWGKPSSYSGSACSGSALEIHWKQKCTSARHSPDGVLQSYPLRFGIVHWQTYPSGLFLRWQVSVFAQGLELHASVRRK